MKRKIYIYTCMNCGFEWQSTMKGETQCPSCRVGDIHCEEANDDDDENEV